MTSRRCDRRSESRMQSLVHELANQRVDDFRALVRHPVAGAGHDLDAKVGNPLAEAAGEGGQKGGVVLTPDDERRYLECLRGDLARVLLRHATRRYLVSHARRPVVVEPTAEGTGLRPGLVVDRTLVT